MKLIKQLLTRNDCYKSGKTITPKGVMVHSTGANNPNLCRYVAPDDGRLGTPSSRHWNQSGTGACVHAFVGRTKDGRVAVYQTLPWTRRGWHAGKGEKGSANDTHISFEICEDGLEDVSYFEAVYRQAVELTAYLCRQFDLDPLADGVVICHSEGHVRGVASNHADVMHWFPRFGKTMDDFRADVAWTMEREEKMKEEQVRAIVREELAAKEAERAAKQADDWAMPYVQEAIKAGIMSGVDDGEGGLTISSPLTAMSRQEAATMGVAILKAVRKN